MVSSVFFVKFDVVYNLFFEDSKYNIIYSLGFDRCLEGKDIVNFYSLCNNLLRMCDINIRVFLFMKSIMFIIFLIWKLSYLMEVGDIDVIWNVLNFVINLFCIVKVKFRFFYSNRRWILGY